MIKNKYILWLSMCFVAMSSHAELVFVKQNSAPKYFADDSNQQGLCDLIYLEMAQRLKQVDIDVKIDPDLYPIKRILALLLNADAHVYCGAGRNKTREATYYYSRYPVYHPSNVLVMHQDDEYKAASFTDLQERKLVVGAFFGASSTSYLKTFEGIHVVDHFRELSDGFDAVAKKQIPYFYYHDLGSNFYVEQNDLPLKIMPTKFRVYDHWLLYSQSLESEQINSLDTVLKSMIDDGSLDAISQRFLN